MLLINLTILHAQENRKLKQKTDKNSKTENTQSTLIIKRYQLLACFLLCEKEGADD